MSSADLIRHAAMLLTEPGEHNPDYDRALVDLVLVDLQLPDKCRGYVEAILAFQQSNLR